MEAGWWADVRPNDHDHPGVSRSLPCSTCRHDHSALPCDWCACGIALRNGVDF